MAPGHTLDTWMAPCTGLQDAILMVLRPVAVVSTWEERKSDNPTLRVLKSGGWTPQPVRKLGNYCCDPRPHTLNRWPQAIYFNLVYAACRHTLFKLMAPGHTLSVDGPRPHTLVDMPPDHTLCADGPSSHSLNRWPHATHF